LVCASGNNSVVECNLAKVEVASSNLVSRSIFFTAILYWNGSTSVGPFFIDRIKVSQYKLKVYLRVGILRPEGCFLFERGSFFQKLVRG
jgi:hypothetical protein